MHNDYENLIYFTLTSTEKTIGAVDRALLCLRDLEKQPDKLKILEDSFINREWTCANPFICTWKEMEFIYNRIKLSGASEYFLTRKDFMLDAAVLRYVVVACDLKQSNALNRKTLSQNLAGFSENARREKRSHRAGFMSHAGRMRESVAEEEMMAKLTHEEEELCAHLDRLRSGRRAN